MSTRPKVAAQPPYKRQARRLPRYSRLMATDESPTSAGGGSSREFEPPERHKAADRAGKALGNMAGSINAAIGVQDVPVVLDTRARHVSIKELEDLIDRALDE